MWKIDKKTKVPKTIEEASFAEAQAEPIITMLLDRLKNMILEDKENSYAIRFER